MEKKILPMLLGVMLLVGVPAIAQVTNGNGSASYPIFGSTVTIKPTSSTDALDINMPASATGNAVAIKNNAGQTLFAVPGGADSSHNSSQVASIAAIPIDTTNDAFFANIPSSDTVGNCYVCQDNSVTQAAIAQTGQVFSSPGATTTDAFKANMPSGSTANGLNILLNNVQKFHIDNSGNAIFGAAAGLTWNDTIRETQSPHFSISDVDEPGVLADTSENFGSYKAVSAIKVTASHLYVENAAGACTTLPIYELVSGTSYNSIVTTIVSSCTPASGTAIGNVDCTTTTTAVASGSFVWWQATTPASVCAAKIRLTYDYIMQ